MNTPAQATSLLAALIADFGNSARLVELCCLLALGFLLWLLLGWARQRIEDASASVHWLSASDWRLLVFPAVLLPMMLITRAILAHWQSVFLLNLAVPLLLSFLAIQSVFFMLRRVFNPGARLHTLQRIISWAIWGVLALHIAGYLGEVVATLDAIGFDIGKSRLSLYSVLMGGLALALTLILALWLARVIESRLEGLPLHANMRIALGKLMRGVLLVLAVLAALPIVGIDITVLSVFGGALGVGLGLGLQKIAANYVAGFTLLLDQSIRIGDMVTVGTQHGEITQIATRYTVIKSLDGSETIIPNESLITAAVVNHSLSTPDNQVAIPVQVAYDTDLRQVESILLEVARQHPRVIDLPAPKVRLAGFGESGIDMTLVVWIRDPAESDLALVSDINWGIWDAFLQHHITIPYPQRVVQIRPVP